MLIHRGLARHLFYPPFFLSAVCMAEWRTILSKSACWGEMQTTIIRDADGVPRASPRHHLVSPIRFANGRTWWNNIPTVIPTTKSRDGTKAVAFFGRGKALHLLPQGTLSNFCTSIPLHAKLLIYQWTSPTSPIIIRESTKPFILLFLEC